MANLLVEKMFSNSRSLLLRQHTVQQSFFMFYQTSYGLLPCHSTLLLA